jgi:hypothetical protein
MMVDSVAVLEREEEAKKRQQAGQDTGSFKCEECGKIIAAPADRPPACCGEPMRRIR